MGVQSESICGEGYLWRADHHEFAGMNVAIQVCLIVMYPGSCANCMRFVHHLVGMLCTVCNCCIYNILCIVIVVDILSVCWGIS